MKEKEELQKKYPKGCSVRLLKMDDKYAPPVGTCGTVIDIDDISTVHVRWDNGSTLGVVYGEDEIERLNDYFVSFCVTGVYTSVVQAASKEEAIRLADAEVAEADFGNLSNIEWEANNPLHVEEVDGE